MNSKAVIALLFLIPLLATPLASAQEGPFEVNVGILVINFGNYDGNKGTYLLDFYLIFTWDTKAAPERWTPATFEFMNGRASAKDIIFDETNATTGERELWYRIQANLYSEPAFSEFPFDTQQVKILFEDSLLTNDKLVYVPMTESSGLDEGFNAAGWRIGEPQFEILDKTYKFGEDYSRVSFTIPLARERFSTAIKTLLPPAAFILVAGLTFFIHPSKWANRLALGTGMLISSVMFHISQTVALPPMAKLIVFDKVMIAVYIFVVGSLAVTTLLAIDEDYWKESDHTRQINLYGAGATLLVSGATLILLLGLI